MAKTSLKQVQSTQQKLSQQNIQLFKMMEMNLLQFDEKVKEELDVNPALDNIGDSDVEQNTLSLDSSFYKTSNNLNSSSNNVISTDSAYNSDNKDNYWNSKGDDDNHDFIIPVEDNESLIASLNNQLTYLNLTPEQILIGEFIIGSIDDDGYLRRSIDSILDDLSFRQNFYTTYEAIEEVIESIHDLDPPGIGARNLQECLAIQLKRKKYSTNVNHALSIILNHFEDYTKKNYSRILKKLNIDEAEFEQIQKIIHSLNPSPGNQSEDNNIGKYIIPDFFITREDTKLEIELHAYNKPNLVINKEFIEMLKKIKAEKKKSKSEKDAQEYVADKLNKANQFLTLIKERQETMILVMNSIVQLQTKFFLTGEESNLRPMGLKNIAEMTHFDISTISRITSSKYVQTEFGIFALKSLFSEGLLNSVGEEISNREIMKSIENIIDSEDKTNPFSDDELTALLKEQGYLIARRTVAKYRENLKIGPKHNRKVNN